MYYIITNIVVAGINTLEIRSIIFAKVTSDTIITKNINIILTEVTNYINITKKKINIVLSEVTNYINITEDTHNIICKRENKAIVKLNSYSDEI